MTPQQAIEILDKAAASVQSNRDGHLALIEALRVLTVFVLAHPPTATEAPTP